MPEAAVNQTKPVQTKKSANDLKRRIQDWRLKRRRQRSARKKNASRRSTLGLCRTCGADPRTGTQCIPLRFKPTTPMTMPMIFTHRGVSAMSASLRDTVYLSRRSVSIR